MPTKTLALALLFAAATAGAAQADDAPVVIHEPVAEAPQNEPLRLTARVTNGWKLARLSAVYRLPGRQYQTASFGKSEDGRWAAIIDAKEVRGPSLEYYVEMEEKGGRAQDCFASAVAPHPILVRGDEEEVRRQDRLLKNHGNTSSATIRGDYVSFGSHGHYSDGGQLLEHKDQHYQLEIDYQYKLLGVVESIRLGAVRVRGSVPPPGAFVPSGPSTTTESTRSTGFDYGFGELAVNANEWVGFSGRVILGADELGFTTGIGGALRVGQTTGAYAEVGGQVIQRAGFDAFLKLHWDTVPRWPLALGLHISDMPKAPVVPGATPDRPNTDGGAPVGIRALLDLGYEATPQLTLLFRAGYQARFSTDGGPTLGGGVSVAW